MRGNVWAMSSAGQKSQSLSIWHKPKRAIFYL